jgi:hypothetical protein
VKSLYISHYRLLWLLMTMALCAAYAFQIYPVTGVDLAWRLTEARYFISGINPFDVFVDRSPMIQTFGQKPAAYSFFSYYFAAILNLVTDSFFIKTVIFGVFDIFAVIFGIQIAEKLIDSKHHYSMPLVIAVLLVSPFFWQQLWNLNYTFISIFGLTLLFLGINDRNNFFSLLGLILIGLKPSLAIPTFIYLFVTKRWNVLFLTIPVYLVLLLGAAYWINTNPISIITQLQETQRIFATQFGYHHSEGFFLFLRPLLLQQMTLFSVLVTGLVLMLSRKHIYDPLSGMILTVSLSTALFYNQVHAWPGVYLLLVYAVSLGLTKNVLSFRGQVTQWLPCLLLIIFIDMPRLASAFDEQYLEDYLSIHNIIRFGLLFLATFLLIQARKNELQKLASNTMSNN